MKGRRFILPVVIALSVLAGLRAPALKQDVDPEKAAKVKAAYIVNFARYTEWPAAALGEPDQPIRITVLGAGDVEPVLRELVSRLGKVHDRSVLVQHVDFPKPGAGAEPSDADLATLYASLRSSHVLFVCQSEGARIDSVLAAVKDASVLTVSDAAGFAQRGGMLGLVLEQQRIAFEANPQVIQRSSLVVSAKVLKLARIVDSEGAP